MRKLILIILFFTAIIIAAIMVFNASTAISKQLEVKPKKGIEVDSTIALQRLSRAIQFPTIYTENQLDTLQFSRFQQYLTLAFPYVHSNPNIEKQTFNKWTLVYKWKGRNPNLKPILLLANQDVIDPNLSDIPQWTYNPYVGKMENGFVWGAGTMQAKTGLLAIMEALEKMSMAGVLPNRTIYFALTHDQTKGSRQGGKAIATAFQRAKIYFEYILTNGSYIATDSILSVDKPIALLGVCEKPTLFLEIATAISNKNQLHTVLQQLEKEEGSIRLEQKPLSYTLEYLVPETNFWSRLVFTNTWLLASMARTSIATSPHLKALAQRTTYIDKIQSLDSAQLTRAFVRISLPNETSVESTIQALRQQLDSTQFQLKIVASEFGSRPSVPNNYGYELLQSSIKQIYPNTLVIPTTAEFSNDALYFQNLSTNIFYFMPFQWTTKELNYAHRTFDERIANQHYIQMVQFYYNLLLNSCE